MLGDTVKFALEIIGITPDRVEHWLGRPCRCEERREKLNQLDAWARRVVRGKVSQATEHLNKMMSD